MAISHQNKKVQYYISYPLIVFYVIYNFPNLSSKQDETFLKTFLIPFYLVPSNAFIPLGAETSAVIPLQNPRSYSRKTTIMKEERIGEREREMI